MSHSIHLIPQGGNVLRDWIWRIGIFTT